MSHCFDDITRTGLSLGPDHRRSFTYTPPSDFNGTDTFTYTAHDDQASSNVATVTINVGSDNDVPVAAGDDYAVDEDQTLTVPADGVLANDSDADADALTPVLAGDVSHGTLTLNADGSFDYTPAADFHGNPGAEASSSAMDVGL